MEVLDFFHDNEIEIAHRTECVQPQEALDGGSRQNINNVKMI